MTTGSVHQAKTHLSRFIAEVLDGGDVVIARGKEPVVRMVPVQPKAVRRAGRLKGKIDIDERFFEPLPDDELAAWNCED